MTYIQPVFPALILLILLLLAFRKRPRANRNLWLALVSAMALFLWGWPPFAWLASGTLEWQYPIAEYPAGDAEAIVVLGAGAMQSNASQPEPHVDRSSYQRSLYAAWLYKHWKPLPVVTSGGPAPVEVVSRAMQRVLLAEGVPPAMIWTEERSASTYQNAVFTAALLRARGIRRIVLVTEAYHMARSERCFRKQGLMVTPAPCAFRTLEFTGRWSNFVPGGAPMSRNEDVLHEWVGLIWYKVSGRI